MNMNIKEIADRIKQFCLKLYSYIKTVRSLPHSGKYVLLSLLLIIIFTVITFPYDYLIKKTIFDSEGKSFRSITMKSLEFSIISESSAENVEIVLNNGNELFFRNILVNLSVNPYRLFITRRFLADFQLDNFRVISPVAEIIMNLNGNIDITADRVKKIPASGDVKLLLEECTIRLKEISIPGPMGPFPLKFDSVNIQNGIAEIDIVNSIARIRNLKLSGTDLNCSITGTVELSERTDNSKLDLSINIDPESAALEQYKDMISIITNNGALVLAVRGTPGRPDVKIAGTGKQNEN